MKTLKLWVIIGLLVLTTIPAVNAGELSGRWILEMNLGVWPGESSTLVTTSGTGNLVKYNGGGAGGGLAFGRWIEENVAVMMVADGRSISHEVTNEFVGKKSSTTAIGRMHIRAQYNPVRSSLNSNVRPFIALSVGPVIGYQEQTNMTYSVIVESLTETAAGGEVALGVDFILSHHFVLGAEAGGFGMTDFDKPIGGKINYSGFKLGLNLAVLFGHGSR